MTPVSISLFGFVMGTMLSNFHMCGIMLLLRAVKTYSIFVRNANVLLCAKCLVCQDHVSCYFCFVLFPLGAELG